MTTRLFVILIILLPTLSFGQNIDLAKAYYEKAGEAYQHRDYQQAIDYLQNTKEKLGETNPDIIYLEMKSRFALGQVDDKIESLVADFLKKSNAADKRRTEVTVLLIDYREKKDEFRENEERREEKLSIAAEKRKEELRMAEERQKEEERLKQMAPNERVQFVLDKYITAVGGNNAKSLKSMSRTYLSTNNENQEVTKSITICTSDGKFKNVSSKSGVEFMETVANGQSGYFTFNGKRTKMTPESVAASEFKKKIYLQLFPEFDLGGKPGISLEETEEFAGKMAYVIKDENTNLRALYYYYDVITGLKLGFTIGDQKTPLLVMTYDDYKEYEGIKLPSSEVQEMVIGEKRTHHIGKLIDIKFNETYPDTDFE